MKKLSSLTFFAFFLIFVESCAVERHYIINLPKIDGFVVKKIYRLNSNLLAAFIDLSGNRLVYKFNESSATWKRILFKTKVYYKN
tara:strand:- start:118 stop:372 length:255 start_codon:yes stop_codon:yes gene_type:complete